MQTWASNDCHQNYVRLPPLPREGCLLIIILKMNLLPPLFLYFFSKRIVRGFNLEGHLVGDFRRCEQSLKAQETWKLKMWFVALESCFVEHDCKTTGSRAWLLSTGRWGRTFWTRLNLGYHPRVGKGGTQKRALFGLQHHQIIPYYSLENNLKRYY